MYENLEKYLGMNNLKPNADLNKSKKEEILNLFNEKKKVKSLTQGERLDRIEQILGINEVT